MSSYVLGLSSLHMYLASAACSSLEEEVLTHSLLPSPLLLPNTDCSSTEEAASRRGNAKKGRAVGRRQTLVVGTRQSHFDSEFYARG